MHRPSAASTLERDLATVTPRVTVASEEGFRNVPAPGLWGWLAGALVLVVGGTLAATDHPDQTAPRPPGSRDTDPGLAVRGGTGPSSGLKPYPWVI
ncbi:hypothetical protein SAMN05421505_101223 [Sinosporangium album]|uniref:Uncharacterized protein n=2 Tax=Sinosporangium album TaxID=504805 RepID=A0A1G7R2M8_9ACTN|nr:hypothetical protein SAMN05421505_101223 [Sinosporangium album]